MEKQKQNKELQRADDIGGHNVSGTDSRRLNPSDTFIEGVEKAKVIYLVKLYEIAGIKSSDGHDWEIEELTDNLLKSSLEEQREQLMHDQEILVNTILDTKNREIEEQREMIKKEYQGYLKCEIDREEYTEKEQFNLLDEKYKLGYNQALNKIEELVRELKEQTENHADCYNSILWIIDQERK